MQLTQGAIGNLINRYRAVLRKCRLMNVFGSLAVAGMLVMGSAGMATAAPAVAPWTEKEVTLDGSNAHTVNSLYDFEYDVDQGNARNIATEKLYITDGGSLSITGGGRLAHYLYQGDSGKTGLAVIMDGGTLTVGDGSTYSSIDANTIAISGGTVTLAGGPTANWANGAYIGGYRGVDITGGTIAMNGDNSEIFAGNHLHITGGEITMSGNSAATAAHIMMTSDNLIGGDAKVSVTNGKFGVLTTGPSLTIADKAAIDVQGSLLLQPDVDRGTPATVIYGDSKDAASTVSQTGGSVSLASGGSMTIGTGVAYSMSGGTLANAGTLTINGQLDISGMGDAVTNTGTIDVTRANGNAAHDVKLVLSDSQLTQLVSESNAQVNVAGQNANGYAKIDLGESATLDTNLLASTATAQKVSIGSKGSLQAQNLTFNGDTLAIDSEGRIKANTLTLNASSDFTLTDGQLMLKGENGSVLSVANGGLILNGSTKAELTLGEFNSDSGAVNPGGSINADVTATNGTVTVNAGTWTLADGKTLDIQTGSALNIGGGMDPAYSGVMPATLVVNGTLQSADAGNGSQGINVLQGGNLQADSAKLFSMAGDVATIAGGLNTIDVANGGLVTITGLIDGKDTISLDAAKSIASAIKTGDGLIQYKDGVTVNAGPTASDTDLAATSTIVDTTATVTASAGAAALTGGYGANNVAVTNDQAGDVSNVAVNGNLTLVGEGELMTATDNVGANANITKVTVAAGKELNLGYTGYADKEATLSADVELAGANSALNAYGNKTVGDITAAANGEGIVSATAGGTLKTGSIGAASNAVDTVKAGNGSAVASSGDVYTENVDLQGGSLTAAKGITVTTAIDGVGNIMTNGNMIADTGDVTLTAGATAVSGLIQATAGNITATGQDIVRDDSGNTLTLAAQNGTISAKDITASNLLAKTLTASGNVALDKGVLNLTGTTTDASAVTGTLALDNMTSVVSELTVNGAATATGGSLTANSLTFNAGATLSGGIVADVEKMAIAGGNLVVGQSTDTLGSLLNIDDLTLGGQSLLIDPAYGGDAATVSVKTFNSGTAISDGSIGVGQNAKFTFGLADGGAWLNEQLAAIGISQLDKGTVGAVMGVYNPLTIGAGYNLRLDGSQDSTALDASMSGADTAHFAANSMLVINGANAALQTNVAGGTAALTFGNGSGALSVDNGAKLYIADAVAGAQYQVVAGSSNMGTAFNGSTYDNVSSTGWKDANLYGTSSMVDLTGVADATGNTITFTATRNDAKTVFPGLSDGMAAAVNKLYTGINGGAGRGWYDLADVNSADMGVRFLSRATDNRFVGSNADAAVRTIESAARMAVAGAVPQMTKMASDAATNAVVNRLGLANPANGMQAMDAEGKIKDRNTTGLALWIAPTWQNKTGFNMDADNLDGGFNGNIGGVALGADYTFENAIRAGITFNIGGGYAESAGDFSSTTNNMNYWGLGAYAGWSASNFAILGDVSYTSTYNKLKQELDAGMHMDDLKADVQASAWQAGLRGEYKIETSALDIIPHVGVRYMNLHTWGYDVKSHGTVLEGDAMNQNIWTFPVGITFSKDIGINNGWYFRPSVDFAVIPAVGDIKAKQDVSFTGLPGAYEVESQTMDYLTWQGGLGLEFGSDNLSVGVNYTLQAGQTSTGHGLFGTFRYEF